jgi:hypothetical protein
MHAEASGHGRVFLITDRHCMHAEASGHGRMRSITDRHCNATCGCMMMRITEGVDQSEDGVRPRSAGMAKLGSSSSSAVSRPLDRVVRRAPTAW